MTPDDLAIALAFDKLSTDHPDWVIWRSGTGRWWGTRKGNPTIEQFKAGLLISVSKDTAPELDNVLTDQDWLMTAWNRQYPADAEGSLQ